MDLWGILKAKKGLVPDSLYTGLWKKSKPKNLWDKTKSNKGAIYRNSAGKIVFYPSETSESRWQAIDAYAISKYFISVSAENRDGFIRIYEADDNENIKRIVSDKIDVLAHKSYSNTITKTASVTKLYIQVSPPELENNLQVIAE